LWGQNIDSPSAEQLLSLNVGNKLANRVQSIRINSRDLLAENAFGLRPDLLIFEVDLPGGENWNEIITTLKRRIPETGLIALIQEANSYLIKDLISAEIGGIIKQDRLHIELLQAIKAFKNDEVFVTPSVSKILCSFVREQLKRSLIKVNRGLLKTLTNREVEVLAYLTRGLNYKSVAEKLFVSDSTVKTHVNNIFIKLSVKDRTQAVLYALKHGINQLVPNLFKQEEVSVNTIGLNNSNKKVGTEKNTSFLVNNETTLV